MDKLEEFIKEKSFRRQYFFVAEHLISVDDLREFFKDKVIIDKDMRLQSTKRQHGKTYQQKALKGN